MSTPNALLAPTADAFEKEYLGFMLSHLPCAVEAASVKEILVGRASVAHQERRCSKKGTLRIGPRSLPVVDLKRALGLPSQMTPQPGYTLVLRAQAQDGEGTDVAIRVDSIIGRVEATGFATSRLLRGVQFASGIVNTADQAYLLLDMDSLGRFFEARI